MPIQTVRAFVAAVNAHDLDKIAMLMTDDHQFIDAQDNRVTDRDKMKEGWAGYFKWFPDYAIELSSVAADGNVVSAFGFASATYSGAKGVENASWRLPAAWRAVVREGKIAFGRCTQIPKFLLTSWLQIQCRLRRQKEQQ